jgi:hypothetical protein
MMGRICRSALFWFGAAYVVFGTMGMTSVRWVHALPDQAGLTPVSGTVAHITQCSSPAHGRATAIALTTAAGTAVQVLVPKIDFLKCPGARKRLANVKAGAAVTAWIGRYPTDAEQGEFVWALHSGGQSIISLEEMHAAHLAHFRKFRLYGGAVPALGVLMILLSVRGAMRAGSGAGAATALTRDSV